ncbi:MFS transporter [uncultured Sphingosinicella sp.]|uniref:spinster family MFS transporter n=1 Tax=uncultured Sphingosinicella sp. TaxID=478748 RepID=UPI0030D8FAAF
MMRSDLPPPGMPWNGFSPARRWTMLAVLFLVSTVSFIDRSILQILLESIRREFEMSDRMLGLLSGAPFAICYAALSIPFGRAADRGNRKWLLIVALALWSVMTGLCGVAPTLTFLFFARMGVGAGEGGAVPPSHALIADYFPPGQRSRAFGILNMAATAGPLIAMVGGAWIAQLYGWRVAFLLMAGLSLPIGLLAAIVLKEPARHALKAGKAGGDGMMDEVRVLFRKRSFVFLLAGLTCYSLFTAGPMIFAPTYLVRVLEMDLVQGGAVFALATALGTIVGTIGGGHIGDKLAQRDERWLVWLPAAGMTLACPVAMAAFAVTSLVHVFILFFVLATLLMAAIPVLYSAVQHICGSQRRALASAIVMASLHAIGMTIGPLATGAISDFLAPAVGVVSLRYAIILMTSSLIPAIVCLCFAARTVRSDAE